MANRLYPPVVNYSMPAFSLKNKNGQQLDNPGVRIYFAQSDFNNINDIAEVQVTVRYLSNNESALTNIAKARIMSCRLELDNDRIAQTDKYYITIYNTNLQDGFKQGTIYKVQLRFSSVTEKNNQSLYYPTPSWINSHLMSFSEWSTVCLIRPIDAPTYSIIGLEDADTGANVSFTSVDSVFTVRYSQGESSEPLKAWRAQLYDGELEQLYVDSDWHLYTNYDYLAVDNQNSIAFDIILPYIMTAGKEYVLRLSLETRNGYTTSEDYYFTCLPINSIDFIGSIALEMDENEGYAHLHITSEDPYSTNLILRRTSSETNFTVWEDVALKTVLNTTVDWVFNDFTIESGVWYRYGVQTRDTAGRRGALTVLSPIEMAEFENAFLLEENGIQLKLKYDFTISSAAINISESKTDTIGSKYPFVRRNGTMYYRTFQCSGLITGYMDVDNYLFITPAQMYHQQHSRYQQMRDLINEQVNQYDYTYEREFRERVQDFLYDNKIKLFKSLQEGNILVKLMNITLTPKNELGRLLYTFSAQAVEIDEPKLSVLQNYNIQPLDNYKASITYDSQVLGQLSSFTTSENTSLVKQYAANENILHDIGNQFGWKYNQSNYITKQVQNNVIVNDFQLRYLRIEFESDPYLIVKEGSSIRPLEDQENTEGLFLVYGWIVNVNDTDILVQMPNNIYEIKEENFILASNKNISFPKDTQATIYYTAQLNQEIDPNLTPISIRYKKTIGQINNIFLPDSIKGSILLSLQRKYAIQVDTTEVAFDSLLWADIEAEPGVIFYARSSASTNISKFIMNDTGNYLLQPNITNSKIDVLYFGGRQINVRYLYPEYAWVEEEDGQLITHYNADSSLNQFVTSHNCGTNKPQFPRTYDYYTNNNSILMYYDKKWYPCTIDAQYPYLYEIQCPVRALINYGAQYREGVYQ